MGDFYGAMSPQGEMISEKNGVCREKDWVTSRNSDFRQWV
jgi:hypothetical protein